MVGHRRTHLTASLQALCPPSQLGFLQACRSGQTVRTEKLDGHKFATPIMNLHGLSKTRASVAYCLLVLRALRF